jgi:hypoxanthine phosphoribosyltransferase
MDTGLTREDLRQTIQARHSASLQVCTRRDRSVRRMIDLPVTFRGFGIPTRCVVGYGLDDQQRYQSLPFMGMLKSAVLGEHRKP